MTRANKLDKMNLKHLERGKGVEFFYIIIIIVIIIPSSVCYCCCHPACRNSPKNVHVATLEFIITPLRTNLEPPLLTSAEM